jgi:DNA-binding NtrC family response regulator
MGPDEGANSMDGSEENTRILVVEDEALVRMQSTDILEHAGFAVIEATSADQALEILRKHGEVHLLFSGVDMPGSMDGLELARQVHARWPNIRLLLTSGHHRLQEAALPDDGRFIPKPWDQDGLIDKVRETLSG